MQPSLTLAASLLLVLLLRVWELLSERSVIIIWLWSPILPPRLTLLFGLPI